MKETYNFCVGNSPILISMPHVGIKIPDEIASNLTPEAMQMPDVDWHLPLLYDMAKYHEASVISSEYLRYVIDLNRSPDNASLYPGQDTTGLCPVDTFDTQPIYREGNQPNEIEIQNRIKKYWYPYHEKINSELHRILSIHGIAILWDAHSIASHVPRFFAGQLPDLNFGTADSLSCDVSLQKALAETMHNSIHAKRYSHIFNGRFKGGYITRHYGKPNMNIHAVQLEMSQCIYMQESHPYQYDSELAKGVKPLLDDLLETCLLWANRHKQNYSFPSNPI
ncbi:MAG: N-formylglutamate deformylase [Methylotenera sp. RIFCSPLOWO2_02_FULL_45_14]|nr:MAG: N-formylglutamate deformylase [Methylotenera sp. RIFCSPLOWO2_02_FULL_45_14]